MAAPAAANTGMLIATCTVGVGAKELLEVNGQSIKEIFTAYGMGSQTPSSRAVRRRDSTVTLKFRADSPVAESVTPVTIVVTITKVGTGTITWTWTNMAAIGNVSQYANLDNPPSEITQEFHLIQDAGTADNFTQS